MSYLQIFDNNEVTGTCRRPPGYGRCSEMIVRFRARPCYFNCALGEGNYLQIYYTWVWYISLI
jgi:hypothetical protein